MPEKLGQGGIPSPVDYRDAYATASVVATQPAVMVLPATLHTDLGRDLYQAKTPSCVSHSITYLIRLYWFKKTGRWIDFSPRYLDILSAEADIPLNGGRRPRTVLRVATSRGCCTTATLANDTSLTIAAYRNQAAISPAANAEAAQFKIPGYFSVSLDKQSTRVALYLYGATSMLFQVGKELYTSVDGTVTWDDEAINPLRTPAVPESGHQMTPNGWDDDLHNRLRNQWSLQWANKDEAQFNHTKWMPYIFEQWAIATVPNDAGSFLKTLPSPAQFHYQWNQDLKQFAPPSEDVKFLQIALMILGFLGPVEPDQLGFYGGRTASAVSLFQKSQRITPQFPASFGPRSRAAMNALFAL